MKEMKGVCIAKCCTAIISRPPLAFKMKSQTYIDQLADVSRLQIPEHRGLVEVSHVGDILNINLYNISIYFLYFIPSNFSILGGLTCISWLALKVFSSQPTLTLAWNRNVRKGFDQKF